ARHRDLHPHRLALRGGDAATLAAKLAAWRAGEAGAAAAGLAGRHGGVAFVFAGNGAPWPGMAQAAFAASPAFRAAVAAADAALAPLLGWSVAEQLAQGIGAQAVGATDRAQPLLFAVQHGIVAALAAEGIRPMLCLGHSVGEIAAAATAGLLPLEAAARLVVSRSRQQQATRGLGRMAALGTSAAAALPVLAECGPGLEIAAINAPAAITVAGPVDALHRLAQAAAARRWSWVALDLDYAFHSAAMDPLREPLLAELAGLEAAEPGIPIVSTVTGELLTAAACPPAYWWRNLRDPVAFLPAIGTAATLAPGLFLEIGPHAILQGYLREGLRGFGSEAGVMPSLSRRDPPGDPFPAIADRAFALGADPRQGPAFAGEAARRGLPHTPYDRQRHWVGTTPEATALAQPLVEHRLLGFRSGAEPGHWTRHLDLTLEPWLADHRLAGTPVLPAAAMLEMALAAAAACHPEATALELTGFAIHQAMPLEAERARELRTTLDPAGGFALASRRRLAGEPWTLHAEARVAAVPRLPETGAGPPTPTRRLDPPALLALAAALGLDYGPAFQAVTEVAVDGAAGLAQARLARPAAAPPDGDFLLHPARLDGALQGLLGLLGEAAPEPGTGMVPVRFARVVLRRGAAPPALAGIRRREAGSRSLSADLVLRDSMGHPVAVLEGCALQRIRLPGREDPTAGAFHVQWLPALPPAGAEAPERAELAAPVAAALRRDRQLDLGEAALLLEGFCAAAAHAALSGAQAAAPATGPYARLLLEALAEDGLATATPDGPRPLAEPDLPAAGEIWRQVLLEQPGLAQDLAWAALAAERLPAALAHRLAGEAGALPPAGSAGLQRLASVLAEAAGAFAAAWPEGRPLRVLEVGAGAGPLTGLLAGVLAASGRRVLLTVATLPGEAPPPPPPAAGRLEYAASPWDPTGGEAPPVVADLVLGLVAGARLRVGAGLPAVLRDAAAPGATLLLAEPLPGRLWDFCCGQDPAWCGSAPLAGPSTWAAALAGEGWTGAQVRPLRAAPWPALLIGARATAGATLFAAPKLRRVALFADAAGAALRPVLAAALQARGATVTGGTLAEAAALPPQALAGSLVVALAGGGPA
ncbi:acyltransferase domain-containing protein, partial [Paeniroseomonas aquatica]